MVIYILSLDHRFTQLNQFSPVNPKEIIKKILQESHRLSQTDVLPFRTLKKNCSRFFFS